MLLLNSPTVRALELFTKLPERFRRKDERTVWADANQSGRCIDSFLEGPVFDKAGNLYVTDIPYGRVYRLGTDGRLDLLLNNVPSPNGIVLSQDEKFLFVAATRGNCVWRMPLQADGSVAKANEPLLMAHCEIFRASSIWYSKYR
jgi:gluconolactonase